ncbi:hypothetical protein ACQ4PT_058938 [Festuca glaucescens]
MMSVSSRSTPAPSPASSRARSQLRLAPRCTYFLRYFMNGRKESSSSAMESFVKNLQLKRLMVMERRAIEQRFRNELRENMKDAAFEPETFGDPDTTEKISDSIFRRGVVSIALWNDKVLVYACSGIAVGHTHGNIQDHHTVFVTSARLAQKFNDNRTRDDSLRIEVRASEGRTLHGFLPVYDEKKGIAIVTSFSLHYIFAMDTCNPVDLPQGTLNNDLCAFGRATDGTLMGAICSHPVYKNIAFRQSISGYGGPVLYFAPGGSVHVAGLIVKSVKDKITLLPTKQLHTWLDRFSKENQVYLLCKKTFHFPGYSLPKGVKTVIPSGFMVRSKVLQSLGYPLPPPLLFERKDCPLVLTSASLVRTGDSENEIDEKLKIEVFLPRNHIAQGKLELYHENYNIALVRLESDLTAATCPQDILNARESRNTKSVGRATIGRPVVAIGRGTKKCHGLLMASMGEVKGNYKAVIERKRKRFTGLANKPDCQDLCLSTCQIKKVGIGGPLIGLDGSFIGMNFYDDSGTTPFLPWKEILTVVREGFNLLESSTLVSRPVNMDLSPKTLKRKRNQWPVSKPYWFLGGQVHPLDQLVGKVLM